MKMIKAPGYTPKKKYETPSRHIKRDPMMLSELESKVLQTLLSIGRKTKMKHHYECILADAFNKLKISSYSFSGAICSLKRKGFYYHILWTSDHNRNGRKDHPKKCVKAYGARIQVRSDIAMVIDPVFFKDKTNGDDQKTCRGVLQEK